MLFLCSSQWLEKCHHLLCSSACLSSGIARHSHPALCSSRQNVEGHPIPPLSYAFRLQLAHRGPNQGIGWREENKDSVCFPDSSTVGCLWLAVTQGMVQLYSSQPGGFLLWFPYFLPMPLVIVFLLIPPWITLICMGRFLLES